MTEKERTRVVLPPIGATARVGLQASLVSTHRGRDFLKGVRKSEQKLPVRLAVQKTAKSKALLKGRQSLSILRPLACHWRFPSSGEISPTIVHAECPWALSDVRMLRCVGAGSVGKLMLAEVHSQQIAVKVMPKAPEKMHRVAVAEREVLSQLSHPLIETYYGALEDEHKVYLMLEYLPRGDLFHIMKRKKLKTAEIRFVACEVLAALSYLHRMNVVYRDLKPENIMIHESGHVKLVDFGFAKRLVGERTRSVLGSPEYMAPEVVMRKPHGLAVDCWGFGVLLYELYVSCPPFTGGSAPEVYSQIMEAAVEFPPFVDAVARDLIRKALNPEPQFRPTVEAIKTHQYFAGVDWTAVDQCECEAPVWADLHDRRVAEFHTDLFADCS